MQDVLDIQVVPLSPACGAEIRGVDLTRPLTRETVEAIRDAWNKHLVLVFRGQQISQDQQLTFASYFGDLGSRKKAPEPLRARAEGTQQDHEKVLLVSNIKDDNGVPIGACWARSEVAAVFEPAREQVQRVVDRLFFRRRLDYRTTVRALADRAPTGCSVAMLGP